MSNVFVFRRPPHGVITEYFGGGKGGSTTTTNNVTQIPPEVLARYNAVNARAETVAQAPYQAYSQDPNAFVAPLSQTQQAGIQNTNAMAGAAQPYYGAATGLAAQSTGSVSPSGLNVGQYMNPYTQSVVNATQAAMNQQQGQQLSQQQAEAIKGGAFGGERAGLQRAQLMGQQGLAQAQAIAPLYQQNYNQALAAAQQQQGVGLGAEQANRQNLQNAAQLFGSIGTNAQQAGLAGAQAQMQAGQQQQQTQQAGLQALYNQFQQQQGFPYQQAQFLANIATGTGALSGNASSGTSTTTGGGGFFSDERLKENIKKVGETNDGQPIYRYNYKGDQRTQIGLLAQDVEKDHPEAVGSSQGYKTVDYKKATEDAIHKEDGGALSGTDAYSIGAPSAMLRENSGKGLGAMPSLPQAFMGGRDIPIEAGASGAGLAALRAPQATGYSLGTREGKQAELDSLLSAQNQPPGPNGALLGSGPGYIQSRIGTLQDWLNKNNSQGGLVGPQGGSFARGGLADGGYMNPALAYYSPQQAQQGVFQLQPMPQRQILQGTPMQAPQQRQQPDAITSANQMAGLVGNLNSAYKARPDFLRSAEDVAKRKDQEIYRDKIQEEYFQKHGIEPAKVAEISPEDSLVVPEVYAARGGLIGDRDHYSRGGINPYGGNSVLGPIIEEQDTSRRLSNDKVTPPPQPKQQSGGLGELAQMANAGKSLYKGGEWAAGKLGLGAPETAMSATSAEALPGVAGGVVPEAIAPVIPEAATAAAAAAPEAIAAGVAGGAEAAAAAAAAAEAAAAASAMDFLPLLLLKRGGVVPHRKNYQTAGLVPPKDAPVVVEEVPLVADGGTEIAAQGGDGETVVGRGAPMARPTRPVPTPADAVAPVPAPREPKPAPGLNPPKSFLPEITSEGVRDTLSSENFWVPAIAGLGSMLASPNKTLAGAIGSGLVGGTGAYTGLQKQTADIAKQRIDALKSRFVGPTLINGQMMYRDTWNGDNITQQEYSSRVSQHITGKTPGAASPAAVATARKVVEEGLPEVARPAAAGAARTTAAKPEQGAAAAPGTPPATGLTPPAAATSSAPTAATGTVPAPGANLIQMDQAMLDNEDLWKALPPPMRPKALLNDAAAMDEKIRRLEANRAAIEQAVGETDQSKAITSEIASLRTDREAKVARAQQQMTRATKLQEEAASAEIKRKSEVQQEADIIELLPRKQQLELQGEVGRRGAIDPFDLRQKQAEADIQRNREIQTAREKLPLEEEKVAFDANVKRQNDALQAAAKEAKDAQVAKGQAVASLSVMFDKNGKPMISTGPLGPKIANIAAYMSQLGFSDVFIKDFTDTSPSNAQALAKLQTAMAAEIARLEFNGAPVRQSEFLQFLETTPSATLLPEAFKWIVENTILPKANSSINAYKKVKDFTPGIGEGKNIQGQLFDYYEENPWFRAGEPRLGEEPAARASNRAPVPQLTDEQKAALAEEIRARRAAKGTR